MFKPILRSFSTLKTSGKYTSNFKLYATPSKSTPNTIPLSFFHDIPLNFDKSNGTVNMITEIPRYEQGKLEISKDLPLNPIVQDTKKGKLRFINNIFPYHGYPCHYGALPQTWEDPTFGVNINGTAYYGDNDPLDICEISSGNDVVGGSKNVKILGCLAMIDDGEMDWKLIGINTKDKLASQLNDIEDIDKHMPLLLTNLTKWFKNYKLPMNKPENQFEYDGKWQNKEMALKVIEECHNNWKSLVDGHKKGEKFPSIANSTLVGTPGYQSKDLSLDSSTSTVVDQPIPEEANEIYYYST